MGIIARQSIRGTIATYLGVAIGFVTTFFVLTRFLSSEEIGLARVLIDAATLLMGLAQLGTSSAIIRFYPYFKDEQNSNHHGFFFWTLVVPVVGFALFAGIYLLCRQPVESWFVEKSPLFVHYFYWVLPLAFFMLYETVFESNANVLMRIVVPRVVREVVVRLGLLVCYLLYAFRVLSMDGFVLSLCSVYALAALVNIVYVCRMGKVNFRPDWAYLTQNPVLVRSWSRYTAFLVLSALASVLAPMLSSFFVTAKMGLHYTGIYAIATYIAVMVSIPYRSLNSISSPQLAQSVKDNDLKQTNRLVQQVSNNLLLISGALFLLIWINIDLIFHILPNGSTYAAARQTIFLLGLSQCLLSVFQFSVTTLSYGKYYAYTLLLSLLLTAVGVVCNNYLIPLYGMDGAAWSSLIAYAVYYAIVVTIVWFKMRISPFCRSEWLTAGLLVALLIVNRLCVDYLPLSSIWLSSIVRTVCLGGVFCVVAYKQQLSVEINALLRSVFIQRH